MPSKEPKSKIGLNIFLLKYNLESATKIWEKREYLTQSSGSGEDDGVAKHRELPFESGGVAGTLLIKHPPSENTPDWVYFINDGLDNETTDQLKNKSVSALLVLKIKDRQFVLAFGHGRHMLEHSCIDTRFGVKVCLNSIEPGRIASIDKQTFDANPRLTRTQATKISSNLLMA